MNIDSGITKNSLVAVSGALALTAGMAAHAEISATVTLTSDYIFDGITQTQGDPAIQGSIDYAHEKGFYAGIWSSNINYANTPDVDQEVDYYFGYAGEINDNLSYDLAWLRYTYIGVGGSSKFDYNEVMLGLFYKNTSLHMWRSGNYANLHTRSFIWKLGQDVPLNWEDITMHMEYTVTQTKKNLNLFSANGVGEDRNEHYSIGFNKDYKGTNYDLSYHNHSEDGAANDVAQPVWVFTMSKSFTLME